MAGHVYKRCGCPAQRDASGRKLACPKSHGTWTYVADAPVDGNARRKQVSKGGFTTKRDAEAALRESLKSELIRTKGPWKNINDLEIAVAE